MGIGNREFAPRHGAHRRLGTTTPKRGIDGLKLESSYSRVDPSRCDTGTAQPSQVDLASVDEPGRVFRVAFHR